MGTSLINYKNIYKILKGHISEDGLSMIWDLTGGLSEAQWLKARERGLTRTCFDEKDPMIVSKSGRITMPTLGII